MRAFLAAVQFLTRLPIRTAPPTAGRISHSYYFYPIVGLLIGAAAVALRRILIAVFPPAFSITVVLGFLVWITGALHEDGLADVVDAMGAGWTPEQRLTIMKDSHIGVFGAAALVLAVLAKYAALVSMNSTRLDLAIVSAQMLGRWAFLPMGFFNPHAREGLGSEFMKGLSAATVVWGTAISAVAAAILSGTRGIVSVGCGVIVVAVASVYFRRRIGGITGDCLGATFQFVEIATYAVFLA